VIAADHPAYTRRYRVSKWSRTVTALDVPRLLRRYWPSMSKEEHRKRAAENRREVERLQKRYTQELEDAAQETFGRAWEATDYRIAGIGRDEFSDERKERLRLLCRAIDARRSIAYAHDHCARYGPKDRPLS
jgi:hypothetical protein